MHQSKCPVRCLSTVSCLVLIFLHTSAVASERNEPSTITICCAAEAETTVHIAASELADGLSRLFPKNRFEVAHDTPTDTHQQAIYLGASKSLPKVDTPGGYAFYKAQLAHLLKVYPTMDTFVLWFRRSNTPITGLKAENLPHDWRREYDEVIANEPAVANYAHSVGIFVLGKVAKAHQHMLKELGREDVTLGLGSWGFGLQAAGDRFLPEGVGLYPLDFEIQWKESRLETPGGTESVAQVAKHRPIYPIPWANHDDCTYVGPPYPPFENFYDLLAESKCDTAGYGVLHWTTRPLDLIFVGLSDAVWESSKNHVVPAGRYKLTFLFGDPPATLVDTATELDVILRIPGVEKARTDRLAVTSPGQHTLDVEFAKPGVLNLELKPVAGHAHISGLILEPLER